MKAHGAMHALLCVISFRFVTQTSSRCQIEMTMGQAARGRCSMILPKPDIHAECGRLEILRVSPFLRRILHDAASVFGMTVGRLQACE